MLNNAKTNYSTSWDIDQVLLPNPIIVSVPIAASPDGGTTPATATVSYTHDLGYIPNCEAMYQVPGQSMWHQCGLPDGFFLQNWDLSGTGFFWPGLVATQGQAVAYGMTNQQIVFNALNYNTALSNITVRLYIWADKIDY